MNKIVVIASTGGGVLSKVLSLPKVKEIIQMVVSDRECGAINVAKNHGVPTMVLESNNGREFSKKLSEQLEFDSVCFFVSFYTRLLSSNFLNKYENRVLNFHPSILPACPGMDGFGDTVKSGSRFIGSTVHFVDEGIDTGKPLIQSCYPFQPDLSLNMNRHRVFVQQCKMLIQLVEWLNDGRIVGTNILDAKYEFSEFVPNLDSDIAINFTIDWQG